jgi:hypothetical protein
MGIGSNSRMDTPAKLILLKLTCPLTQMPELAKDLHSLNGVVRIPESVFIAKSELSVEALTARLSALVAGKGTVLVASLSAPCKLDGSDVALNQVMGLLAAAER